MAFWTKKTDVSSTNTSSTPTKQSQDLFYSGVKQESKGLFDRKTETLIDVNSALERFGQVRSALGTGTVIQGKLTFDTPVRIDGRLSGEIFSTAALIVGREGVIDASVDVTTLIVLGAIKGPIRASERAEVYSGGSLQGSLETPVLVLEKGGVFNGECKMPQKEEQTADYLKSQERYGQKNNPSEKARGKLNKEKTSAGVIDSAVSESQSPKNYQ